MEPPGLSLRPAPPPDRGPRNVAEFIQRMKAEPDGFRSLNADDLRKQIEANRNNDDGDIEMENDDNIEDSSTKPKELSAARDEIFQSIIIANRAATTARDLVSLLLTKENPNGAGSTLSSELRNLVGIGTLGATALAAPTALSQARIPDNKMVMVGMRLQSFTKAAGLFESAETRLATEINLETTYWNEVRATGERGWSVFRHPDEPHTMGVKFGFSNAAPDFKANSIAPLRRAEDGTVRLEHGRMTGVSKRIQVTITQGNKVIGRSRLPQPQQDDDVKEARDTVFAQELWHELTRESRTLLAYGVHLKADAVTFTDDAGRVVSFRLVTLGEEAVEHGSEPDDGEADRINDTLHLLLIQAHRQNELKGPEFSNPGSNRGSTPVYCLLLPLLTQHAHELIIQKCISFLSSLCSVLRRAGISPPPSFTLTEPPLTGSSTESLANGLLNPPAAEFDLTLTSTARLRITARPSPAFSTRFQVFLLPPLGGDSSDIKANPLSWSYPPASHDPSRPPPATAAAAAAAEILYESPTKLFQYLGGAVPRALAWYCYDTIFPQLNNVSGDSGMSWKVDRFGTAIIDEHSGSGIQFGFRLEDMRLTAQADATSGQDSATQRVWEWGPGAGESTIHQAVLALFDNAEAP
ncbi:subunit 17 of mediator complex-domain-containing protein [Echria macrotheca]|uniref:Mediator of RNA polymerase II transcription subunit 17 n=1 Tax=Echria macrotheca TaxID=438768 RepID=A0AAJ0B3Q4_9PEZI|nr:subunit 17 of mediator complex-domain-containing protein [Echria macrotheca]